MSDDETFASRDEAIDFGKDYEYLMAAYYGLTLSFNDEVKDFKISSNNKSFGDFDDVVIECTMLNGEEHLFALQLKHVHRPIAQITLITNNKKFGLKKYSKEFQKIKTTCAKNHSYSAPFENFHFILFSNSELEKCNDFSDDWKKLEPVANKKVVESDLLIRRNQSSFGTNLLVVPQTKENLLYEFKAVKDDSPDQEFFQQFSFYTKQKDAKEMEALIAEIILNKFRNCNPNVAVTYLNYFNYWCRRDYGALKITKEDVRLKLAELILTPYIPDPDMERMEYFSEKKAELLHMMFLMFDIVLIDDDGDEMIQKIWDVVLKEFKKLPKQWAKPFPGVYLKHFMKHLDIPVSAFSEHFNEISLKKMYILLWHTGTIPLVLNVHKNSTFNKDILSGIELCENNGKKKKFLLIDKSNSVSNLAPKWTIFRTLSDLTTHFESFYDFLEQMFVSIQGQPNINLKDLLEIDKCLIDSVTTKEIVLMIHDTFVIGKDQKKNFPKYYIRRIFPKILLNINVINELEDDLFVVSSTNPINDKNIKASPIDVDKYLLLKEFGYNKNYSPKQVKISDFEKHSQDDNSERFFIYVNGSCTKQQFEQICSMNEERNCHHVRFADEEKIEWIESRFGVDKIQKYRLDSKTFKPEDFVNDEDILSHFKNKINMVCAEQGMGKSVMMKYLALICPSNHWVLMISLGEHVSFFKQEHDTNEVLNHCLKSEEQTLFVRNLISVLSSNKQIMFLWDGFDELPEECVGSVIKTIKSLASEGYPEWVAARKNSKKFLEEEFATLSLLLPEFSQQNQYDYVHYHLKEKYQDDAKVQEIIDEVNKNITVSLNCGYFDYTGIPLQIHMVVDIYLRKPNNVTNSVLITLADIYQEFIDGKFDSLFEKADADLDNHYMQEIREQYKCSQLVLYEKAAIKASFADQLVGDLDLKCEELFEELDEGADSLGLITNITTEKKAIFAHKTYEEFLVASWMVKHCHSRPDLVKILFEEKHSNIRLMFDMLLARDSPIHLAVLYRNLEMIEQHKEDIESCKDRGGRNVLHVACSWGRRHPLVQVETIKPEIPSDEAKRQHCLNIATFVQQTSPVGDVLKTVSNSNGVFDEVEKLLTRLYQQEDNTTSSSDTIILNPQNLTTVDPDDDSYLEILKILLDNKCSVFEHDSLLNWDAIEYADQSLSLGVLNFLIKHNEITLKALKNYNHVPTLLHYSVIMLYDNLLEIVTDIPYIEYRYHFGKLSLLQMASEANNLKVVYKLLKHKSYKQVINNQSAFSGNLLASAAFHGNLEMLDVLLENGAKVNGHSTPPLYAAILGKKSDCFNRLLEAGADVNETASDGNSALILSTMMSQIEFIEPLLKKGGDLNHVFKNITALDCAVGRDNLEAVRVILKYNAAINRQCENLGYTVLHLASELDNVDIVKCLLENGASTTIKSKKLLTPLHVAILNEKNETALELIKADPSVVNEYSSDDLTPMILAAMANFPDVIQTLAKCGADVNATKSKSPALHFAASRQFDSCVIELIKAGASVNLPDQDGVPPLFSATNHLTTTKILLDNSADISARSKSGDTVAHFAAHGTNLEVMEELIERGADLNAQNDANLTPLCVAIFSNQLEMTKCLLNQSTSIESETLSVAVRAGFMECIPLLIEKGVDVNAKDRNGFTPLYYALFNNPSCAKVLLENGADPNSGGDFKVPPLLFSLILNQTNVMNQLINAGANVQGLGSVTSLHLAATCGDIFSLVLLAGNGADVNAQDDTGRTPLHCACGNGIPPSILGMLSGSDLSLYINKNREDCVIELLVRGSHVNQKDHQGVTPLHVACQNKCIEVVRVLLQRGADVNALNNIDQSPLHLCFIDDEATLNRLSSFDNTDLIKVLIDHGVNLDLKDDQERTALYYACSRGDLDSVKCLHKNGADLFVEDYRKEILLAAVSQNTALIKYLVDNGLAVNCSNVDGITPLHRTALCGNYDGTLYLVEQGAEIDAITAKEHLTPIHAAALKDHVEVVQLLFIFNANLSIRCCFGNTAISTAFKNLELVKLFAAEFGDLKPDELKNGITENELQKEWTKTLLFAAQGGCLDVLRFLHELGLAQVTDKDERNASTALHLACFSGKYEIVVYLIESGIDVNAKNADGNVPLLFAANGGYLNIVNLLLEKGAELDVANNHGTTGLFSAASNGHFDIVELFYKNGACVNVVDADGDMPLHDAAVNGHLDVVQFLVSKKADVAHKNKNNKTALDLAVDKGNQEIIDFLMTFTEDNA